jgi:microcystin-dependent protein
MATPFLAQITMFGGNFAPRGWADCSGQILAISQNDALFALLGTTYGGDGQVTFALPDLRGRVPLHAGNSTGPGLSPRILGQSSGSEEVTLIVNELPAHSHALAASSAGGNSPSPENAVISTDPGGASAGFSTVPAPNNALSPAAMGPVGGGLPHNNIPPFLCVRYIIALEGIFPSRN